MASGGNVEAPIVRIGGDTRQMKAATRQPETLHSLTQLLEIAPVLLSKLHVEASGSGLRDTTLGIEVPPDERRVLSSALRRTCEF